MAKKPKITQTELNRASLFLDTVACTSGHKELNKEDDEANPTLGLELENEIKQEALVGEAAYHGMKSFKDWSFHNENSLRHVPFEYVSRPMRLSVCDDKVRGLFTSLTNWGAKPEYFTNSIRTSFHTHFNQTTRTLYDTLLFTTVYYMFEPYLQDFCGKHRQNNLFCLRLEDTRSVTLQLAYVLSGAAAFSSSILANSEFRYGSVNFNSIYKFGTIEFRMMRASSDPEELILWYRMLAKIRTFALNCGTFDKLRQVVTETPMGELIKSVLGYDIPYVLDQYLSSFNSKEDAVRFGYCNALPIIVEGCGYSREKTEETRKLQAEYMAALHKESKSLFSKQPLVTVGGGGGVTNHYSTDLVSQGYKNWTGGPF